ncbi:MAG TPA: cytochrome c [Candidatus Acidoferrales bacterium]|nr:cytochrome c [Candidatus Acidoferrales bacterium]
MKAKIAAGAMAGFAAICLAYAGLCAQEAAPQERSVWDGVYTAGQADAGHQLYHQQCESCHGDTLEGRDEAPALAGIDFLSNWNGLTLGDLFERIRKTMPKNKPGTLTHETITGVLAYMLSFNRFPAGRTELPQQAEQLRQIRIDETKPDRGNKK